jgi:polyhydroxyalkanoate synthesis regulator phasin
MAAPGHPLPRGANYCKHSGPADTLRPMNQSEILKRYIDAGVQFTQLTQKKAEALVNDLVKSGEVNAGQAQAMVTELVERSRKSTEALFEQVRVEVRRQLKAFGVATKDDLARVQRKATEAAAAAAGAAKATAKKATAKKATAKKAPARKTTAKKATAKKAPAKKTTARKSAGGSGTSSGTS